MNFVVDSPTRIVLMICCLAEVHLASSPSGSCGTSKDEDETGNQRVIVQAGTEDRGGSSLPQTFFATLENHLGPILKKT